MTTIREFLQSANPDPRRGIALLEQYGRKPLLPRHLLRIVDTAPDKVMKTLRYELGKVESAKRRSDGSQTGLSGTSGTLAPVGARSKEQGAGSKGKRIDQNDGSVHACGHRSDRSKATLSGPSDADRSSSFRTDIVNDAAKYQRWNDGVAKEINKKMKALYDEGQLLKWTKLGEDVTKEERRKAALRIIEIYRRLLPPLYKDRDQYVHENIKPQWMMRAKANVNGSELPPVSDMMKAIKNLPTYISKYKDNPKRAEDVKRWREELAKYREALGFQ